MLLQFAQKYSKGAGDYSNRKDKEESSDRSGPRAKTPVGCFTERGARELSYVAE